MEERKPKKRIELIDLAKGLAIFMVVWGHTASNETLFGGSAPMLYKVLYSIHMPLFFFLSGMSMSARPMKTREDWRAFIKKDILTVAFPYFIWALIYSTFSMKNVGWIFYGSWQALTNTSTLTSLWYLSCLFVARILVEAVVTLVMKKTSWKIEPASAVIGAALLAIGVFLPWYQIGYPWCLDIAFVASGCVLFGIALRKTLYMFSVQKIWLILLALLASVGIYAVTALLRGDAFEIMQMCRGIYGEGTGALVCAVAGGMAVMLVAMLLRRFAEAFLQRADFRPVLYLGQYTMGVFLLHKPMMQQTIIPGFTALFGNVLSDGWICFLSAVAAILISLALCNVISHYVPELIGIFSKDKLAPKERS